MPLRLLLAPLLAIKALSSSFSFAHEAPLSCAAPLAEHEVYIALSSLERGYRYPDNPLFRQEMDKLLKERATELCKISGCGAAQSFATGEYAKGGIAHALLVEKGELVREEFRMNRRWEYGGRNYHDLGNLLWYLGHCVSAVSTSFAIASRNDHMEANAAVYTGLGFALGGQMITMFSRYVERTDPWVVDIETALLRKANGSLTNPVFVDDSALVPHLRFTELHCSPAAADIP
jgi:hypothetical protein